MKIKIVSDLHLECCEVICNPRGYFGHNSSGLNLDFDPNFEVEL